MITNRLASVCVFATISFALSVSNGRACGIETNGTYWWLIKLINRIQTVEEEETNKGRNPNFVHFYSISFLWLTICDVMERIRRRISIFVIVMAVTMCVAKYISRVEYRVSKHTMRPYNLTTENKNGSAHNECSANNIFNRKKSFGLAHTAKTACWMIIIMQKLDNNIIVMMLIFVIH